MQIDRPKIITGYGDVQKISNYLRNQENLETTDASIRNALKFATDGELADKIRKVATEVFNLPIVHETIEI